MVSQDVKLGRGAASFLLLTLTQPKRQSALPNPQGKATGEALLVQMRPFPMRPSASAYRYPCPCRWFWGRGGGGWGPGVSCVKIAQGVSEKFFNGLSGPAALGPAFLATRGPAGAAGAAAAVVPGGSDPIRTLSLPLPPRCSNNKGRQVAERK